MQDQNKMYGEYIPFFLEFSVWSRKKQASPYLYLSMKLQSQPCGKLSKVGFFSASKWNINKSLLDFIKLYPDLVEPDNAMQFLSDDGGETYNRCHCEFVRYPKPNLVGSKYTFTVWSNFEIGNLDLWRGEAYSKFFDFLDEKGGFYYEVLCHIYLLLQYFYKCFSALGWCTCP